MSGIGSYERRLADRMATAQQAALGLGEDEDPNWRATRRAADAAALRRQIGYGLGTDEEIPGAPTGGQPMNQAIGMGGNGTQARANYAMSVMGGRRTLGGQRSGTHNQYGDQFEYLRSTNPQLAAMMPAPNYVTMSLNGRDTWGGRGGVYQGGKAGGGEWTGGTPVPGAQYAQRPQQQAQPASFGQQVGNAMRYQFQPQASFLGGGAGARMQQYNAQRPAGQAGGGITNAMSAPGVPSPSVASGYDPMDPYAATRAQEADRNAAIQTMQNYQQGIGGSQLARGAEGLAAGLIADPEAMNDSTYNAIRGQTIEANKSAMADQERALREDLAAAGRTGTGGAMAQLQELRRGGGEDLTNSLRDLMVNRALRKKQDQLNALAGGGATLDQLARIYGAPASKIADIYNNTERDDQSLQRALYMMMLGAGGGYGG